MERTVGYTVEAEAGVDGYARSATAWDEERGGGVVGVSDGVLVGSLAEGLPGVCMELWSRVHQP